jgi:hypothetical protein
MCHLLHPHQALLQVTAAMIVKVKVAEARLQPLILQTNRTTKNIEKINGRDLVINADADDIYSSTCDIRANYNIDSSYTNDCVVKISL